MQINVGPFVYQIVIHPGLIDHQGEACFGLCDNLGQAIYVSDQLPARQRLQVFFHELMHAWWYHFGLNIDDEESIVDLVGMAMTDFMIEAAKCIKKQTATQIASGAGTEDDAFMRFIGQGVAEPDANVTESVSDEEALLVASVTMLGGKAKTPETKTPEITTPRGNTQGSGSGSEGIRKKSHRTTRVYQPVSKLNPLAPMHAIRHGEWVVKIYDPEVEEDEFVA
jgi:hypothetical protein